MRELLKKSLISALLVASANTTLCLEGANLDDVVMIHPEAIHKCLESHANSPFSLSLDTNPYYLRGNFDGDRRTDYAVAIRGSKTKRNGILMCTGRGRSWILGADEPLAPPFSDMPDDNFVGPNWMVRSVAETKELGEWITIPRVHWDTISFTWEDGEAIIYWDGRRFRWAAMPKG